MNVSTQCTSADVVSAQIAVYVANGGDRNDIGEALASGECGSIDFGSPTIEEIENATIEAIAKRSGLKPFQVQLPKSFAASNLKNAARDAEMETARFAVGTIADDDDDAEFDEISVSDIPKLFAMARPIDVDGMQTVSGAELLAFAKAADKQVDATKIRVRLHRLPIGETCKVGGIAVCKVRSGFRLPTPGVSIGQGKGRTVSTLDFSDLL